MKSTRHVTTARAIVMVLTGCSGADSTKFEETESTQAGLSCNAFASGTYIDASHGPVGDQAWTTCRVTLVGVPHIEGNLSILPGVYVDGAFSIHGSVTAVGDADGRIQFNGGFYQQDGDLNLSYADVLGGWRGIVFDSNGSANISDVTVKDYNLDVLKYVDRDRQPSYPRELDASSAWAYPRELSSTKLTDWEASGMLFQKRGGVSGCDHQFLEGGTITINRTQVVGFRQGIVSLRSSFFQIENSTIRYGNMVDLAAGLLFDERDVVEDTRFSNGCGTSPPPAPSDPCNGPNPPAYCFGKNPPEYGGGYSTNPCPIIRHNDVDSVTRIYSRGGHYEISENSLRGWIDLDGAFDQTSFVNTNNVQLDAGWKWGVRLTDPATLPFFSGNYWSMNGEPITAYAALSGHLLLIPNQTEAFTGVGPQPE